MTKDNQGAGARSRVLSHSGTKVYQRVTGNEGPSPLMKRYLKSRKKGQPMRTIRDKFGEVC